jgi:hypothetical protein
MDESPPTVKWRVWLWWPCWRSWRLRLEDVDFAVVAARAALDRKNYAPWRVAVTSGAVPDWIPKRKTMLQRDRVDALPNGHTASPEALPAKKVRVAR